MLQSMTGFGKATCEYNNKKIVIEVKSLNSKQLDVSIKIPNLYREKELEIRNEISQKLERGKIDFSLFIENAGKETATQFNQTIIEGYYQQINDLSEYLGINPPNNWFDIFLRLPDSLKTEISELDENEWQAVKKAIQQAFDELKTFRMQEGKAVENVFYNKISNIQQLLNEIAPFEAERIEKIKEKLKEELESISDKVDYDKNRMEQELIYYIEKLDINEEKSRLQNHLNYFIQVLEEEQAQGKKLGFIAQEIGREINTLGAKANHSEIQKIVVKMKDELEQIKEQVLNVL
ncbi:MAG TPA: YicC family protein [Paludibacteraceae bacterium]|nr:YicC family protein [Paludibacteraceae bacterium]HOL00195.1 YicC family protein [Paludibacteraceae bacterium]HPC26401.1 YicC family protein [Paludibacteraceae bacterium]HPO67383.1 YicC family protein [Paludibacteraceae bacterium]